MERVDELKQEEKREEGRKSPLKEFLTNSRNALAISTNKIKEKFKSKAGSEKLYVTVFSAHDLLPSKNGQDSPYCKLEVGSEKKETKVGSGVSPVWNETFIL